MSKVPPDRRCESDEGSADGLGDGGDAGEAFNSPDGEDVGELSDSSDGASVEEPSDNTDGIPSECDGDDSLVGTGLLRKKSGALILSRRDFNFCCSIADEIVARRA